MRRLMLSGPMSHRRDSDWNVPAFDKAKHYMERWYRAEVVNPLDVFRLRFGPDFLSQSRATYMRITCELICEGELHGLALLDGWDLSTGAMAEAALAQALALRLYSWDGRELWLYDPGLVEAASSRMSRSPDIRLRPGAILDRAHYINDNSND